MSIPAIRPLVAVFALAFLNGCNGEGAPQDGFAAAADTIYVAAAWSWESEGSESYWRGLSLGAELLNGGGGVGGRPVSLIRFDDGGTVTQGRLSAQRIVNDGRFFGVIGHKHSHISVPVSGMYDRAGMIMINPASTAPELTRNASGLVFRIVNSDELTGRQLSSYASSEGYRRVVICYVRNAYGLGLANAFEAGARQAGIEVVDRQSYEPTLADNGALFVRFLEDWKDLRFDAVLFAGAAPDAAGVIRAFRETGVQQPILGGDALDDQAMLASAGQAAEGLVALSVFHPENPNPATSSFLSAFSQRYGTAPDSWAARGYEAVSILAGAARAAGSTDPSEVASQLRARDDWNSLHGPIGFDEMGEPVGRAGIVLKAAAGRFVFGGELPSHHYQEPVLRSASLH